MKNIKDLRDQQLERINGMWLVRATELQWKANKMKARLKKRLEREGKRHATLEPIHHLLANSKIILDALMPHGESIALELVRKQVSECEVKIHDVTYRYNLLSDEEIILKQMDLELAEMKATMARAAKSEVEEELASRVVVFETVNAMVKEVSALEEKTFINSKKRDIELGILRTLRQAPNTFARLKSYTRSSENGKILLWRKHLLKVKYLTGIGGLRLRLAG